MDIKDIIIQKLNQEPVELELLLDYSKDFEIRRLAEAFQAKKQRRADLCQKIMDKMNDDAKEFWDVIENKLIERGIIDNHDESLRINHKQQKLFRKLCD